MCLSLFSADLLAQERPKTKTVIEKYPDATVWTDVLKATEDDPSVALIGEYIRGDQAVQVTRSADKFYLSQYGGGLPGAGWDEGKIAHQWLDEAALRKWLTGWEKIDRSADVVGMPPPPDAIVLFDGTSTAAWNNGRIENGCLKAGTRTKRRFQDFRLYFEFLVPLKPEPPISHPHRGNSGVFAVGAYEIQIADTFALDPDPAAWHEMAQLKPTDTWCGSIYGLRAADLNMCLPPLVWQTMEIDFRAARYKDGRKASRATISVVLNGVRIHDEVELTEGTGGGPSGPRPEVAEGPIVLQNHGNPNLFRNIWIVEK